MNGVPCRVSGDLRRHQAEQVRAEPSDRFDEYLDNNVAAVVPYEMVKPVMDLLQTRREMEVCERAGGFDKAAMCDALRSELDALYLACVSRWNDL